MAYRLLDGESDRLGRWRHSRIAEEVGLQADEEAQGTHEALARDEVVPGGEKESRSNKRAYLLAGISIL
jgi:hypothetical protein